MSVRFMRGLEGWLLWVSTRRDGSKRKRLNVVDVLSDCYFFTEKQVDVIEFVCGV